MAKLDIRKEDKGLEKTETKGALSPFLEMEHELERMLRNLGMGIMRPLQMRTPFFTDLEMPFEGKIPNVDVIDRDGEILVRAELPGVEKKDLEVTLIDNALTIKGTTKKEEKEEKGDYFRREVSTGSFSRMLRLPTEVDVDKVQSTFKDGLLELTLPKVKQSRRRTINVE